MKPQKQTLGTIKPIGIPPIKKRKCPSCQTTGEYETDPNLNVYCKKCGLIIETPYPYTAGLKHWSFCDFTFNKRIRELKKNGRRKKTNHNRK